MTSEDLEYYRERARTERALADAAADPKIAAIHLQLAERYEILAAGGSLILLLGAELIDATHPAFEDREEPFDSVGVSLATD